MNAQAPQRLSVRDINARLTALARQREDGALSHEDYRDRRDRLIDGMASPAGLRALVDDALTETFGSDGTPMDAAAGHRRKPRPPRRRRSRVGRFLGWVTLAALITGLTMMVATLISGRWS